MTKVKNIVHVVLGGARNISEVGYCTHCGVGLTLPFPMDLVQMAKATKKFAHDHASCRPVWKPDPPRTLKEWAKSREISTSSLTIYSVLSATPITEDHGVPLDAEDFGKCYRLLQLAPEWRTRLPEVARVAPEWMPYVRDWERLEALFCNHPDSLSGDLQHLRNSHDTLSRN